MHCLSALSTYHITMQLEKYSSKDKYISQTQSHSHNIHSWLLYNVAIKFKATSSVIKIIMTHFWKGQDADLIDQWTGIISAPVEWKEHLTLFRQWQLIYDHTVNWFHPWICGLNFNNEKDFFMTIDNNHKNRSYTIHITKMGWLLTRNSKHVKATPITAEQYLEDQVGKHTKTDPLEDFPNNVKPCTTHQNKHLQWTFR